MLISQLYPLLERHYRARGLRTWRTASSHLRIVLASLGEMHVEQLTDDDVERHKERRESDGAARGTVNQELAVLRSAVNIAIRAKLARCDCTIQLYPPAPARRGFLRAHEFERLAFALEVLDRDVADLVRLLWGLGWRAGEVIGLTWDEADATHGTITLSAERTKNKSPRTVRLHGQLRELIHKRWLMRAGPWVFHRAGKPIKDFRGAWVRAREAIGKSGLLVHDLRRSFARNAMLAGIPQPIIQQIGGWKTASMFYRYAIVDEGAIEDALRRISEFREG